jgi:hypothetical protein
MNNQVNWMQQGWECPKCGAVMSPTTSCCVNCRGNKGGGMATTITDPITVKPVFTVENPVFNKPSSICADGKEDPEEQWERYQLNV